METENNTRAIVRHNQHGKDRYIVILCPRGHLIESHKVDRNYAGSHLEAELSRRKPGDRWDRLAAKCGGHGCPGDKPE